MTLDKGTQYGLLIEEGYTQAQVARMFGVTRQAVHAALKYHELIKEEEEIGPIPFIWYKGHMFCRRGSEYVYNGNGKPLVLHCRVWNDGGHRVPKGKTLTHIDGNPENNAIENLELVDKESE